MVQGIVGASTEGNILPVLNKIPYVGPALLVLEKFGDLKVAITADGKIALFSELTWLTTPDGSIYPDPDVELANRRHFLGGVERGQKYQICFNFGLGLKVNPGERAGAEGGLKLKGENCSVEIGEGVNSETMEATVIDINPAGDWPLIKRISGKVTGNLNAYLDAWVTRCEKDWEWDLIRFDYQYGTEPAAQWIPMSINISLKTLRDYGPVHFADKTPTLIEDFLPSGSYAMAQEDGALLFTDVANNGEFQLKLSLRQSENEWGQPSLIHSGGVILDSDMISAPGGGWWIAWSEVAIADENNPFAPTSIYATQLGADGQFIQPPHMVSVTTGAAVDVRLTRIQDTTTLVALTKSEGPGSSVRSIVASV